MKNAATYLITFLIIFFLCPYKSAAQDIDGELKSYAALCDSCLMLKKSLSEGSTISPDKAKSLIGKFVETGKKLKSRSMSPWQKDMYRLITERFTSSSYTEPFTAGIPVLPAMNCEITGANETTGIIARETNAQKTNAEETTRADKAEKPLRFSIIASVSFPYLTGGLMLGIQYNGWGGYIRGTTNFTKTESTYTCLSNGTLPDGSEFWGGGQNQLAINTLTAGAMLPVIKNLCFYAGAGTGKWTLTWMDMDSNWAKVSDRSHSGIAAEAGLVANWKFLAFSAGVTTIKFNTFQANVGVGVRF